MTDAPNLAGPAFANRYEIAGRHFSVEAPSETILQAAERFFSTLHAAALPTNRSSLSRATLRISFARFELPAGVFRCAVSEEAEYYQGNSTYLVRLKDSWISAGATPNVRAFLEPGLDPESFLFDRFLSHGLSTTLRRAEAFELHSAVLVEPESGLATLIIGPSGSGKSTLALHLAASGWDFSTDDVALLTNEDGLVRAQGLRECFALTSETAFHSGLPRLQAASQMEQTKANSAAKIVFLPQEIFSSRFVKHCVPAVLIFPHQTGENGSRVQLLSQPDVMKRLLQMCPWALVDTSTAAAFQRVLGLLTKQCVGFDLFAGTELLREPEYAATYIANLMRKRAA